MIEQHVFEWTKCVEGQDPKKYTVNIQDETCTCMAFLKHAVCKHLVVQAGRTNIREPVSFEMVRIFMNRSLKNSNRKGPAPVALPALQRQ